VFTLWAAGLTREKVRVKEKGVAENRSPRINLDPDAVGGCGLSAYVRVDLTIRVSLLFTSLNWYWRRW
jgi:hypothetical protein